MHRTLTADATGADPRPVGVGGIRAHPRDPRPVEDPRDPRPVEDPRDPRPVEDPR